MTYQILVAKEKQNHHSCILTSAAFETGVYRNSCPPALLLLHCLAFVIFCNNQLNISDGKGKRKTDDSTPNSNQGALCIYRVVKQKKRHSIQI